MTSSPQVCNDVVIIGNAMSDSPSRKDSLAARHRAGDRRPDGTRALDVQSNPAAWRGRQRDMGRGFVVVQRRRQRVVADQLRRATRPRVSADWRADQRHVRRPPAGRQPVFQQSRLRALRDRRARLALPAGAPRPVGLRHQRRADPRGYPGRRQSRPSGGAAHQAGDGLRLRPRDRQADLADRRAPRPDVEDAGRKDRAHAAVPDQTGAVRSPRPRRPTT